MELLDTKVWSYISDQMRLNLVPKLAVASETVTTLEDISYTQCSVNCMFHPQCTAIQHCTDSDGATLCEMRNEVIGVSVTSAGNISCVYYSTYDYSDLI